MPRIFKSIYLGFYECFDFSLGQSCDDKSSRSFDPQVFAKLIVDLFLFAFYIQSIWV